MTALLALTPAQLGVTLILLSVFAFGVRETLREIGPVRPSPNAALAMMLCALIGAMLFFGSWVMEGGLL
jgi:hypothetical protein